MCPWVAPVIDRCTIMPLFGPVRRCSLDSTETVHSARRDVRDSGADQGERRFVQADTQRVVGPEHALGLYGEVALDEQSQCPPAGMQQRTVRPVAQILG